MIPWIEFNLIYRGELTAGESVREHKLSQLPGVMDNPVTNTVLLMVDTAGCDMAELTTQENISKANEGEAAIVYYHINELVENGVNVDDIAVVTPYNLQVELLRTNMREKYPSLEIKSVDGYQGREKEVVVLSLHCCCGIIHPNCTEFWVGLMITDSLLFIFLLAPDISEAIFVAYSIFRRRT